MKIASKIRKLFRVQYRLSVIYRGEVKFTNIYGQNSGLLRVPADNFQKWIDERQRMLESAKAASGIYCQKKGGSL